MTNSLDTQKGLELPVLRLGVAGFTATQEASIKEAMQADSQGVNWELSTLADADAWFIDGSRLQPLSDGTVRIAPGLTSGRSIRINLQEVEWPVVISGSPEIPLSNDGNVFHTETLEGIGALRKKLEGRLNPLIIQHYLASKIVEQNLDLREAAIHVSVRGRLLAVISMRSGVGVWPIAEPAVLPHAQWLRRPLSADAIPNYFVHTDFSQLLWRYAMRTPRDWLPPHYRTSTLYLRRPPRLPLRMLDDSSLLLVRELSHTSGTFSDLRQRTGIADAQLSRCLAALYLVGAITATASRAPAPAASADLASGFEASRPGARSGPEMTVRLKVANGGGSSTIRSG
jgi:hypothetical protein